MNIRHPLRLMLPATTTSPSGKAAHPPPAIERLPSEWIEAIEHLLGEGAVMPSVRPHPVLHHGIPLWRVPVRWPVPNGTLTLLLHATTDGSPDYVIARHATRHRVPIMPRLYHVHRCTGTQVILLLEDPGDHELPADWLHHTRLRDAVATWLGHAAGQHVRALRANSWRNGVIVRQRVERWGHTICQAVRQGAPWLCELTLEAVRFLSRQHAALVRRLAPHSLWLVHGDLRPEHMRLTPSGVVAFHWHRAGYGPLPLDVWDLVWHLPDREAWEGMVLFSSLLSPDLRRSFTRPLIQLTGAIKALERLARAARLWTTGVGAIRGEATHEGERAAHRLVAWAEQRPP
ncbi:MAG: hypothetical protein Q9O62_00575 [Ardenticatenia bacterium]|nr:hypothetical protein [Ardenticatenia bacterium]